MTSEIVQSQSLELRVRVIEKYIRIALVSSSGDDDDGYIMLIFASIV